MRRRTPPFPARRATTSTGLVSPRTSPLSSPIFRVAGVIEALSALEPSQRRKRRPGSRRIVLVRPRLPRHDPQNPGHREPASDLREAFAVAAELTADWTGPCPAGAFIADRGGETHPPRSASSSRSNETGNPFRTMEPEGALPPETRILGEREARVVPPLSTRDLSQSAHEDSNLGPHPYQGCALAI